MTVRGKPSKKSFSMKQGERLKAQAIAPPVTPATPSTGRLLFLPNTTTYWSAPRVPDDALYPSLASSEIEPMHVS